jgi:uncharacterized protein
VTDAERKTPRVVACPRCNEPVTWGLQSPFRPFCSERCKTNDLGAWATEQYRMPDESANDSPSEPADE